MHSAVHVMLKKMQLYLNIFLFYLNICFNGHILTKCNLISMDLGESGPQVLRTVGQSIVFTVLGGSCTFWG